MTGSTMKPAMALMLVVMTGSACTPPSASGDAPSGPSPTSGATPASSSVVPPSIVLGGATPHEVWARMIAAQQAGDLVEYARCLTPEKRFGIALQLWMIFDLKYPGGDLTAAMKGTVDQVARVAFDETPAQAARRNDPANINIGDQVPDAEARYRKIMAHHGLTPITQRTRPAGPAGFLELASASEALADAFVTVDAVAFIDDLSRLVTEMQGGKKPTPPRPVSGAPLIAPTLTSSTVGYRKGQIVRFERVDGRWFCEGLPD